MVFLYPRVASTANRLLIPFPLAWLCEVGFIALLRIMNKARTKLIVEPGQRCAPPEWKFLEAGRLVTLDCLKGLRYKKRLKTTT